MQKCCQNGANSNIKQFMTNDNCGCQCHFQENCDINIQNSQICQNIYTIHSLSSCRSYTPSPDRALFSSNQNKNNQTLQTNISTECLCLCENICNCPCHCISCLCCPCVNKRSQADSNTDKYDRMLYNQIKLNLEEEKKRNMKLKCDKNEMNTILDNKLDKSDLANILKLMENKLNKDDFNEFKKNQENKSIFCA